MRYNPTLGQYDVGYEHDFWWASGPPPPGTVPDASTPEDDGGNMDFTQLIDSVVNAGAQAGTQALANAANGSLQQYGTSAHIQAQNQTVAAFATILNEFHAGTLSPQQGADLITRYDQGFTAFCQHLAYARAIRGAQDVHNLAIQILNDNFAGVSPSGGVVAPSTSMPPVPTGVTLPPSTLSTNPLSAGISSLSNMSPTTLALLGVLAYELISRKKLF